MYKEKRLSQSEFVPIRGLRYHVQCWHGTERDASLPPLPPLVLVHGWMDVGASWQFMVDALQDAFLAGRTIIAPDWRGFGKTRYGQAQSATSQVNAQTDYYWFTDYLADLDFLLDHYAPDQAVDLCGHSMGGNVSMLYAGIRPSRIRKLVNLEGFGMPATQPKEAPARYATWMDELKSMHRGELNLKTYGSADGVARRLMKTNSRLPKDKADWLAGHWARPDTLGQWHILGDPAHKIASAQLYRVDEALEIYKCITAPLLCVEASDDSPEKYWKGVYSLADYHERLKNVPQADVAVIQNAGHMLHHDQPEVLAQMIEEFLS